MKYFLDLIALFGFPITMRSFHVRMLWLRNQLGKCNFPWVFASLIILSIADRFTILALPFNIQFTKAKKFAQISSNRSDQNATAQFLYESQLYHK